MKPVRGSARASSKQPVVKNTSKKKTQKPKHNATSQSQLNAMKRLQVVKKKAPQKKLLLTLREDNGAQDSEPGPSALNPSKKKRKAGDAPPAPPPPRKLTGQKQWKPMPASSISALDSILDMSILAALYTRKTDVKEIQKHLNAVKNGFLAECKQLKVPIQRPSDFSCSSRQHQEHTKESLANESNLSLLERGLETVLSTLETMEEQKVSLDHKCSNLIEQLKDEEERAKEIFHIPEQGILKLAPLPPLKSNEATLQEQMMRMIPNTESETTARRLGRILLKSAQLQDAQALLIHAHKHADQLMIGSV